MDAFPSPALPLVDRVLAVATRIFPEHTFEAPEEEGLIELYVVMRITREGIDGAMSVVDAAKIGFEAEPEDELLFLVAQLGDGKAADRLEDPRLRQALGMDERATAKLIEALNELLAA